MDPQHPHVGWLRDLERRTSPFKGKEVCFLDDNSFRNSLLNHFGRRMLRGRRYDAAHQKRNSARFWMACLASRLFSAVSVNALTGSISSLALLLVFGLATPPSATAHPSDSAATLSASQAMQAALKKQLESLEKQRRAIHQQLGSQRPIAANPVPGFIDPLPADAQADCPTLDSDTVAYLVQEAANKQSLQPELVHAVIKQESAFRPCAVSFKGALGLMQLMPSTARQFHVNDVFDPEQNIQAGAAYLKQLLNRYKGDLRLALIAYNAGPGRADRPAGQSYPLETQNYVASIFADLGISQSDDNSPDSIQPQSASNQQTEKTTINQTAPNSQEAQPLQTMPGDTDPLPEKSPQP